MKPKTPKEEQPDTQNRPDAEIDERRVYRAGVSYDEKKPLYSDWASI